MSAILQRDAFIDQQIQAGIAKSLDQMDVGQGWQDNSSIHNRKTAHAAQSYLLDHG